MKKQLCSVGTGLLGLLLAITAHAQFSVGLSGGYTRNYLYTSVGPFVSTRYSPADGFSISVPIQYAVTDWLAVQAEAQFVQKNHRLTRTGYYEGVYTATINQYLQLPVMGRFSFGGRHVKGFLNLGGYAGYWATSRQQGIIPNVDNHIDIDIPSRLLDVDPPLSYNELYMFDSRKDQRMEVGWLAGLGITYQPGRYQFFVEGRYTQSMLDQQKAYMINQTPRYNQTYSLQFGLLYQLNQHR